MPQNRKPKAVLNCIGTKLGCICIRAGEWEYQPINTSKPSNKEVRLQKEENFDDVE